MSCGLGLSLLLGCAPNAADIAAEIERRSPDVEIRRLEVVATRLGADTPYRIAFDGTARLRADRLRTLNSVDWLRACGLPPHTEIPARVRVLARTASAGAEARTVGNIAAWPQPTGFRYGFYLMRLEDARGRIPGLPEAAVARTDTTPIVGSPLFASLCAAVR